MNDREANEIFIDILNSGNDSAQKLAVKGLCTNYEGRQWLRENVDKYPRVSKEIKNGIEEHQAFPSVVPSSVSKGEKYADISIYD